MPSRRTTVWLAVVAAVAATAAIAVRNARRTDGPPRGVSGEQYASAERRARQVLGREPTQIDVLSLIGELAFAEGRMSDAVACFREIPSDHPRYGLAARLQEGQAALRLNSPREAERNLREYLALARSHSRVPAAHFTAASKSLAYIYSVELRFEDREAVLKDLHASDLADVYDSKQYFFPTLLIARSAFGKEKLDAFLAQSSRDPLLQIALGRYQTAGGDLETAARTLEGIRNARPHDLDCLAALLERHYEADDRERLAGIARSLPDYSPEEPWLLTQMRGLHSLEDGRFNEAAAHFRRVLDRDPANPICRMGLARAYGGSGRAAERDEALRGSLALSEIRVGLAKVTEDDPAAAVELAATCERAGLADAAECFRRHAERIDLARRGGGRRPEVAH